MNHINPNDVPKFTLASGVEIPVVGMGTFGNDRFTPEQVSAAVKGAALAGYRLFDCAACYGNEEQIGKVFKAAFDEGVVKREELFIMSKVWNDMHRRVAKSCEKTIADLQCDYLDMLFIHWPFPNYHAPFCDVDSRNPDSKPFSVAEFVDTYRQIEALVEYTALAQQGEATRSQRKALLMAQRAHLEARVAEMRQSLEMLNRKIEHYDQFDGYTMQRIREGEQRRKE